ncbi:thiamine pyrophosphate-dependent enzyme [Streptomyces sp. CA-249302]|uniref:thiamine pyrophosphate-dependent enzyme n=1 Tax=Streptomyces sp. CA-249302 TaxID=3240058 RepID=UPI003D8D9DD9
MWQTSLVNPDFAAYARSWGATGISAATPGELEEGMAEFFRAEGPALLHLRTDALLV